MRWNKKQIIEYLDNQEDWVFEINRVRKKRSVSQNRYLHFIFSLIADEIWEDAETVKEVMKSKFLKQEDNYDRYKSYKNKSRNGKSTWNMQNI